MGFHGDFCVVDVAEEIIVVFENAALDDFPVLLVWAFAQDRDVVTLLKDNDYVFDGLPILELPHHHSVSNPENIQPIRLVVRPLPVDVLSVADVDHS